MDQNVSSDKRKKIVKLLQKNKVPIGFGTKNIHLFPLYQRKIAYGKKNFPWSLNKKLYNYKKGICKNAESLQFKRIMTIPTTGFAIWNKSDLDKIVKSFERVWLKIF